MRWWENAVLYQIYPRSFYDYSGDGIGDLNGITAKLDYLKDLGVKGIWISPFFKSPMKDFGYDVSDYTQVDPLFGTNDDFEILLSQAHQKGLKIIVDLVLSHTSDQHPWFAQSRQNKTNPKADWYVWADPKADGTAPNNWMSIFGGVAWQWDVRRQQYYLHNFLKEQPDLNFHHPQVRKALLEQVQFWCEKGVDGFRFDVINFIYHDKELRSNPPQMQAPKSSGTHSHNPYAYQQHIYDKSRPEVLEFLKELRSLCDAYGDLFLMGEVVDDYGIKTIKEYTDHSYPLSSAYTFDFFENHFSKDLIPSVISRYFEQLPKGMPTWAFSNHDVSRTISRWFAKQENDPRVAKFLQALLLSLPGQVLLYQGEECGFTQSEVPYEKLQDPYGIEFYPIYQGRDGCRTPLAWGPSTSDFSVSDKPWLPVDQNHLKNNIQAQISQNDSILNWCKQVIAWRQTSILDFEKFQWISHHQLIIIEYPKARAVFNPSSQECVEISQWASQVKMASGLQSPHVLGPYGVALCSWL